MDKYFYSVEMDGNKKVVHLFGNVYLNDVDETETNYRHAEWTGLYIDLEELKELIEKNWDYLNKTRKSINIDGHIYNMLVKAFAGRIHTRQLAFYR